MSADVRTPQMREAAQRYLDEAAEVLRATAAAEGARTAACAERLADCLRRGGVLYTCGNGGSAADAQHVAAELSGKFFIHRPGLPSVALTTNTSALTAIGNDFSFDEIFERQLAGAAHPGDFLMAFSTSGRSPNIRRATDWARAHGVTTAAFTGDAGAEWAASCDFAFVVPSSVTPHIQQAHITLGHAICALAEAALFGPGGTPPGPRTGARGGA